MKITDLGLARLAGLGRKAAIIHVENACSIKERSQLGTEESLFEDVTHCNRWLRRVKRER